MKLMDFNVLPNLPEKLKPLLELAYNVWWAWDSEAFALFRDIDPDVWSQTSHNPVKLLYRVQQERLETIANDEGFIFRVENVLKKRDQYMSRPCWYDKIKKELPSDYQIAYFSAEFGLAECLPIYSGGLGVLAGDHLKSASDLGLPFTAVGLLYSQGYFHQYLTTDGWQHEKYVTHDYNTAPVKQLKKPDGSNIIIELKMPHGIVKFSLWKVQVGRINLYLMDTNIPENSHADREITSKLYGGDLEMRIKQEYLLGIGGMIALDSLGIKPTVTHMNEGHSSFLALERIRMLMEKNKLSFSEAKEIVAASSVFTTHTPVPAGNDRFPQEMMERYLKGYVEHSLKISFDEFMKLGRVYPEDKSEWFCMTVLALKLSHFNNGVSKLHGRVSRDMWKDIWTGVPLAEVPISHITNGIHMNSWISKEMADLFFRYLGTRWVDAPDEHEIWKKVDEIPDTELWSTHERRKERLVEFIRRKLKSQLKARGSSKEEIDGAGEVLSSDVLTIGFARRFATYKRATLMMRDIERLKKILTDKHMPVQIIFAGKAHPKDDAGKEFIKQIIHITEKEGLRNHIVFVEDYDLNTAHYLVQGVDVWMNNPRRPLEASGTSGMKVIFNGGLNFSVLDGWWDEKADADNGWCIGRGEEYEDIAYQDAVEANAIYDTLENDLVPLYYKRGKDGLPHDWVKKMKTSIATLGPVFNTNRQVMEYTEMFYKPAGIDYARLTGDGLDKPKNISKWKEKIASKWGAIRINSVNSDNSASVKVGGSLKVYAEVESGGLNAEELLVEIYAGYDRGDETLADIKSFAMKAVSNDHGKIKYEGVITPSTSGSVNYSVRVMPSHPDVNFKFIPGYIKWFE
ncbi:MAG TPA: alpha-glucan family phosphorylase [Candidatus Goldiibacteriota bacterium]|nr:alpha-glucan family phosphorylase [Candidatus Goldiibacteriota bacterium]HPN65074.1 alpha-glucan family phosphorylase [Candidatus Goldiibacteriota bacterium]HRQ42813.1 alpha-glucan family phosphorylase [Candidatus Goldiibacteriota bacterium]